MKIVDYRKNEDRLEALRGIEIYPFIEPDKTPRFDGYFQVYAEAYQHDDTNFVETVVSIKVNCAAGVLSLEQSRLYLGALAAAYGMALAWQDEEKAAAKKNENTP